MERTISSEERIRRAEEIYNNRRQMKNGVRVPTNTGNQAKEYNLLKKILIQIAICMLIYFIFYLIKNSNYIFSENVINQTRAYLSYDINFEELYSKLEGYYNDNIKNFLDNNEENNNDENTNTEDVNIVNDIEQEENIIIDEQISEIKEQIGIGGGEDQKIEEEVAKDVPENLDESTELSQMEIDANEIKNNYSLIVPLNGIISSRFGPRAPTDIVSANHAGIDIAASEGTVFIASMAGTVTYISTEGGYGNHFWVQEDDVVTLYAHCSQIYVNEGDIIEQGQEIGEVGQTGNATGPHLHFEIRKSDRLVNPELILDF